MVFNHRHFGKRINHRRRDRKLSRTSARKRNIVNPRQMNIRKSLCYDFVNSEEFIPFSNAKSYNDAIKILKEKNDVSFNWIAESLSMEERTFRNIRESEQPKLNVVIATCVIFHLLPHESKKLLEICGYTLRDTPTENRYQMILSVLYDEDLDTVNEILEEEGEKPLTKSKNKG